MRRAARLFFFLSAGVLLITASPLYADDTASVGGSGGAHQRSVCPPQHRLAGLQARIGNWMDHVLPLCVPFSRDDRWAGPLVRVPGMGSSSGGNPTQLSCPPDSYINDFRVTVYDNFVVRDHVKEKEGKFLFPDYVAGVRVSCWSPVLRQAVASLSIGYDVGGPFDSMANRANFRVAGSKYRQYVKIGEWQGTAYVKCPGFVVADGIQGRAGVYVDSFGLTCQQAPPIPLPPLTVQVQTSPTRPAALMEWKTPDQSGNRIIDRFVLQKRRIITGWGSMTVWDEIAVLPVPMGVQTGTAFNWSVPSNLNGQTIGVCSENLGGRVCAEPVTVVALQLQTPSTTALASPKPQLLAMNEPPVIEAPKSNDRVQGPFQLRVTRPKVGDGPTADVELTWLDTPPNQPRYISVVQIQMDELVRGIAVPEAATQRQLGRWQIRVRVAAPNVGPWSKPIPIHLALASPPPTQPIQQQAPQPSPQIQQAIQPAPQSAPLANPQGTPIQSAPGSSRFSGAGVLQPKTKP